MARPSHGTLQNTATTVNKGGGTPPQATPSNSGMSLSNSSFSGQHARATVRGTTPINSVQRMITDGDGKQPWMETATPGKFDVFQAKIFPVIEYLTSKPEHVNHSFTKRWLILKRTPICIRSAMALTLIEAWLI
jgi:hypothetical protein